MAQWPGTTSRSTCLLSRRSSVSTRPCGRLRSSADRLVRRAHRRARPRRRSWVSRGTARRLENAAGRDSSLHDDSVCACNSRNRPRWRCSHRKRDPGATRVALRGLKSRRAGNSRAVVCTDQEPTSRHSAVIADTQPVAAPEERNRPRLIRLMGDLDVDCIRGLRVTLSYASTRVTMCASTCPSCACSILLRFVSSCARRRWPPRSGRHSASSPRLLPFAVSSMPPTRAACSSEGDRDATRLRARRSRVAGEARLVDDHWDEWWRSGDCDSSVVIAIRLASGRLDGPPRRPAYSCVKSGPFGDAVFRSSYAYSRAVKQVPRLTLPRRGYRTGIADLPFGGI